MAESQPGQSSSALPAPNPTPRFVADGEALPPYKPTPEDSSAGGKVGGLMNELPHEIYAARVAIVAALKREGYTRQRIAKALKMTPSGVAWCIRKARERGEMQKGLAEALTELDEEAVPLAVEGLIHHLRKRDKEVCLAVAQGKGLLRTFSQVKNEGGRGGPNLAFQFNFVMPDGSKVAQADPPAVENLPGQIVGVERDE